MKLHAIGGVAVPKRLIGALLTGGQQGGPGRQVELIKVRLGGIQR